jgi:hypothetical protein
MGWPLRRRNAVPPPTEVVPATSDLEKFLHDDPARTPILIKAALAHAQFETIHPFLDGNGRVGRLLITLLLCSEKVLQRPLLYLSLYFKQHRDAYYEHLQRVRTEGAWEQWLEFFLEGVIAVAGSAAETATRIRDLSEADRDAIHDIGRGAASALRVHELASRQIMLTAGGAAKALALSIPTSNAAISRLQQAGIVREVTGRRRGRSSCTTPTSRCCRRISRHRRRRRPGRPAARSTTPARLRGRPSEALEARLEPRRVGTVLRPARERDRRAVEALQPRAQPRPVDLAQQAAGDVDDAAWVDAE